MPLSGKRGRGFARTEAGRKTVVPDAVASDFEIEAHEPGSKSKPIGLVGQCALAFALGIVTGLGAVLFRDLIGLIHNVMFLGTMAVRYDANVFTPPSPWGALIILVPVIGAVAVTFVVNNFAPEARGHGVPEVMDAIYYNGGRIRPVVAVIKSLASAIAIGTGAAVGREGPIIQIGSAMGSTLGQIVTMTAGQRITLVAAGAGAGIAATFNTPIGGVLFAIELMMPEVSATTFLPAAIATGTATFVGRLFFGSQPAFFVPAVTPLAVDATTAATLALYAALGVIVGIAATGFIRGLHLLEDVFDRIANRYLRHVLGMLLVGLMMYALFAAFGHYYVEGVGYATIQ
jgi:CIC family chloride channel protein